MPAFLPSSSDVLEHLERLGAVPLAAQERPHGEVRPVVLRQGMHGPFEVTHRLLELLGFVREAGEGEVGRELGFAPLVVLQGTQEALQRLLAGGHIVGEQARAPHLQP